MKLLCWLGLHDWHFICWINPQLIRLGMGKAGDARYACGRCLREKDEFTVV